MDLKHDSITNAQPDPADELTRALHRAGRAEAELAALKRKIEEAPVATVNDCYGVIVSIGCDDLQALRNIAGKRIALVVLDE